MSDLGFTTTSILLTIGSFLFSLYIIYIANIKFQELKTIEQSKKVKLTKITLILVATISLSNTLFIFSDLIGIYNYAPFSMMGV